MKETNRSCKSRIRSDKSTRRLQAMQLHSGKVNWQRRLKPQMLMFLTTLTIPRFSLRTWNCFQPRTDYVNFCPGGLRLILSLLCLQLLFASCSLGSSLVKTRTRKATSYDIIWSQNFMMILFCWIGTWCSFAHGCFCLAHTLAASLAWAFSFPQLQQAFSDGLPLVSFHSSSKRNLRCQDWILRFLDMSIKCQKLERIHGVGDFLFSAKSPRILAALAFLFWRLLTWIWTKSTKSTNSHHFITSICGFNDFHCGLAWVLPWVLEISGLHRITVQSHVAMLEC